MKASFVCHHCQTEIVPHDKFEITQHCHECNKVWDVDENAGINALAALHTELSKQADITTQPTDAPEAEGATEANQGRFAKRRAAAKAKKDEAAKAALEQTEPDADDRVERC